MSSTATPALIDDKQTLAFSPLLNSYCMALCNINHKAKSGHNLALSDFFFLLIHFIRRVDSFLHLLHRIDIRHGPSEPGPFGAVTSPR